MKSAKTHPLDWFGILFDIFRQITANKSFQISISSLALADTSDICVQTKVMEICDLLASIGPESVLIIAGVKVWQVISWLIYTFPLLETLS